MSVICQADALTRRFIVELGQDAGLPNQNFSINSDRQTLSGNPTDIDLENGYAASDSPPDDKRHRSYSYRVKTPLTESISWQLPDIRNLLVAYELILTVNPKPLRPNPYSGLPVEVGIALGWLFKSYWNPDSMLFNPTRQHFLSILKQGKNLFQIVTVMYGSGYDPAKYPSSESSGQQTPRTHTHTKGTFTSLLNHGYSDGDEGPEQEQHTLGLNCFVYPCRGVCRFRSSFDSREPAEKALNSEERSTGDKGETPGQSSCSHLANGYCFSCLDHSYSLNIACSQQNTRPETRDYFPGIQTQYTSSQLSEPQNHDIDNNASNDVAIDKVVLDQADFNFISTLAAFKTVANEPLGDEVTMPVNLSSITDNFAVMDESVSPESLPEEIGISFTPTQTGTVQTSSVSDNVLLETAHFQQEAQSIHKSKYHNWQVCDYKTAGKDGQSRLCGTVCKNAKALTCHKSRYHSGKKICDIIVVGEDGQQRPCWKACKNAKALSDHRKRDHTGPQICQVTVVGEDGQQRPCGKSCKNVPALLTHKSAYHNGQQRICNMIVVGKDGQRRPCLKACMHAKALSDHRNRYHTGPQICEVTVVGEDGQQRPCGKACKNILALYTHKSGYHTGEPICDVSVFGEDGQRRPCGKVCNSAAALARHKNKCHTGTRTCNMPVIGEDGQKRPCGKVCKNKLVFAYHKTAYHCVQPTCDVIVIGEDSQQRPCGMVCKNVRCLSSHKSRYHGGQQTCDVVIVSEDGQTQSCGTVCPHPLALWNHKKRNHCEQKNCNLTVIGKDGRQQPCGKVFKNAQYLSSHKGRYHGGEKTCDVPVVSEDGQTQPCRTVCINAQALKNHKRRDHGEKQTCYLTLVGEDGQKRPCGVVCKNASSMSDHMRRHRKRQHVDVNQNDEHRP
ncbi:hypothetical protein [Endozoicomonas sp. 8E]|uniref:hypothetical protein n=1 Tax=Endozoicomonas sp. 8E TaxID=3035692 RepID=UPI002938E609|nr:hypothetical protein [Endozoicomonas sp. 8E]WOG26916.1 hypothetical protein P6910_20560 [Endozoicomonas sp. 8E]